MLKIYQSNSLESLFSAQNDLFDLPLVNPFTPEIILVQSQGMARWLALQTAGQRGIAANIDCLFPAAFVWRLVKMMTAVEQADPYEPQTMVWGVASLLDKNIDDPSFEELKRYLAGPGRPVRLYQLAQRIALLFDQYMLFRPDWITSWSDGAGKDWQPILWRHLLTEFGPNHRVAMLTELMEGIDLSFLKRAGISQRISLFGIPALPPTVFSVFSRLAEFVDVHFFSLNPSQEYWVDLLSPREFIRLGVKIDGPHDLAEDLHYETGNSLLLNLGKMGRDFQLFLQQYDYQEVNCFAQISGHSVLTSLQRDILNAVETPSAFPGEGQDLSIQCHAVHSPLREVEVLSDNLLAMFQNDPSLTPADILVMVPDISGYAPLIEAVFGAMAADRQIPFTIADRSSLNSHELVGAFVELLSLAAGRFTASGLLDFLAKESVRSRFAIGEDELDNIRSWLSEAGICWGLDKDHRQALGLPAEQQATWQTGLDRLLLGYAMPESDSFFLDILPVDIIEGSLGGLLARFLDFYNKLAGFSTAARQEMTLGHWLVLLLQVLDDLFGSDERMLNDWQAEAEYFSEKQIVRDALAALERHGEVAKFSGKVPLEIVQAALVEEFDRGGSQSNFLSGGVTFCQMVPMRSVPFKVIALLGLNDGDFPREERAVGFDLMADDFRLCDRCRRDDDRYLFLEALLAARQIFYLSYVGLGLRNNEISAPSVVVGELLAVLARKYNMSASEARQHFILFHPLHPFSPRYFQGDKRLNHFSAMDYKTANALGQDLPPPGLFCGVLQKHEHHTVTVAEFIEFFCHPVRFFLKKKVGLVLDDRHSAIVDRELFSLDSLGMYALMDKVIAHDLEGGAIDYDFFARQLQSNGQIPLGKIGSYAFQQAQEVVADLVERVRQMQTGRALDPLNIDLDLGSVRVIGQLTNIWSSGLYLTRPSMLGNMNYRDYIRFWLAHLFFNVGKSDSCQKSFHFFLDGQKQYDPVPDALAELRELARLFSFGMRAPLPLFPKSTMLFVKQNCQDAAVGHEVSDKALASAKKMWQEGDFYNSPEREDPYLWAAFGDKDPFSRQPEPEFDFIRVAEIVMKKAYLLANQI